MISGFYVSGHKRKYPSGPRYPMTREWKVRVTLALKQRGITRSALADMLGVSRGAVTQMLSESQPSSALVPATCQALELPMPAMGTVDEFMAIYRELPDEQQKMLLSIAMQFHKQLS